MITHYPQAFMSFLPPNHSNGNGNHPPNLSSNGNGRVDGRSADQLNEQLNERDGRSAEGRDDPANPVPIPIKPLDEARIRAVKRQANRLYITLVVIGLAIGLVTSVGVVTVIRRLGLTEVVPIGEPRNAPD
jgi:hypothetical protein